MSAAFLLFWLPHVKTIFFLLFFFSLQFFSVIISCGFQSARGCHIGVYQKFHWLSSYWVLGCTVRFYCISGATAERPWHSASLWAVWGGLRQCYLLLCHLLTTSTPTEQMRHCRTVVSLICYMGWVLGGVSGRAICRQKKQKNKKTPWYLRPEIYDDISFVHHKMFED